MQGCACGWWQGQNERQKDQPTPGQKAADNLDAQGNPTLDPAAALMGAFLPWGGHRGYGLALVVQVLAVLSGGKTVAEQVPDSGFFFLVVDPAVLLPADEFRTKVGELVAHIEASRPAPGFGGQDVRLDWLKPHGAGRCG